ncbi:Ger(x)C family spore germination protein [Cohnella suwonensis]|uniref:Ger(X)C family spore germination protein n=1 Tax=Cohnella suwonensis TaxID=696072 RepID=A0ABW0LSX2_9BACL
MIRKLCKYSALLAGFGLLTGCWDRIEMDDIALVMGSGIDITDDGQLDVSLQIALPTGTTGSMQSGGKDKKPVLVVSTIGKDGMDVQHKMQKQLSRRVFLGHRGVIVIGEKYARQGVDQVLDNLLRTPDARANAFIVTTYGCEAKEIMKMPYDLEQIPAIGINKVMYGEVNLNVKIDDFLSALSSDGSSPVTAGIRIINKGTDDEIFSIDRIAVYRENKLAGFLSRNELKAYLLFRGQYERMKMSTQIVPKEKSFKGTVGISILGVDKKIRTTIKNGTPEISVSLKVKGRVWENDTNLNLTKAENLNLVKKKFTDELQKMVESLVDRAQKKYQADIFDFGREVHIEHPYVWKQIKNQWIDLYPTVPVIVKADFTIERMGRTQAPPHLKREFVK